MGSAFTSGLGTSMKETLVKLGFEILSNIKVSLATLVIVIFFLTPVFTSVTSFVQRVEAHDRQLKEHSENFKDIKVLNEKLNLLMIQSGISEYRIKAIESQINNK